MLLSNTSENIINNDMPTTTSIPPFSGLGKMAIHPLRESFTVNCTTVRFALSLTQRK